MMAAKPLMSLVVRAAAMEKAAIVAISSASTIQSSSRPAACIWKPKAVPMATTTTSKANMSSMEARMRPARMANRLAGVTRSRSVTPDPQLEDRARPGPLPPGEGQQGQDARQEEVEHVPGRQAGRADQVLEQRGEQGEVKDRGGEADHQPDRAAQQLDQVAAEEQADVGQKLHAVAPEVSWSGAPVLGELVLGELCLANRCLENRWSAGRRPEVPRPAGTAGLAKEHVVQTGLGQPERPDGQARLVQQPEQAGQGGRAVTGVQPDRVARHGEIAYVGLPGQFGGRPPGRVRVAG